MSDFHLNPLTASELKEGQRFVWAGDVRQSLGIEGSTFDASVEDGPEAVLVESPCPAQRKWEALREFIDWGVLMIHEKGDPKEIAVINKISEQMDAIDKEQAVGDE